MTGHAPLDVREGQEVLPRESRGSARGVVDAELRQRQPALRGLGLATNLTMPMGGSQNSVLSWHQRAAEPIRARIPAR